MFANKFTALVFAGLCGTAHAMNVYGLEPLTACPVNAQASRSRVSLSQIDRQVAIRLVRAGMYKTTSYELIPYMDEARAERIGHWGCTDLLHAFKPAYEAEGVSSRIALSIAMNESKLNGAPWPWTMNVRGRSHYFKTREQAYHFARRLVAKGEDMFDIGLMQTNWRYHAHRYNYDIWLALQPTENVKVGARILRENYDRTGSWERAVKLYHSANSSKNSVYFSNFLANFLKVTGKPKEQIGERMG